MASSISVGLGVGVTLGVLVVIAILLVIVGVCTSGTRTRDFTRERERRLERVRQQHEQEQVQWRERRLRDVVLLLIERGEAMEGVSLAFQLPNRPEVSARRTLRTRHGGAAERQQLEMELANEDENSRMDAEARAIAHKPLEELLANGRPADADPGPDVMQMLLDGQEVEHHTTSEDDDDFLIDDDEMTNTSATPSFTPQTEGEARMGRSGTGTSRNVSAPPTPPLRPAPLPRIQVPSSLPPDAGAIDGAPTTTTTTTTAGSPDAEMEARTAATLLAEQRRRESREAALLHELHREKRRRRRKTSEELYGTSVAYGHNPANDMFIHTDEALHEDVAPQSPLWRFLTPLTPFRGNRSRTGKKSAFDGRSPEESSMRHRDDTGAQGSPLSAKKKNRSTGASPF
ncbi:hypothetical protein NESM_000764800 [Novymonas esmeraldas]|uniref:Membrane-associated protein n=1 Tax=Novymonas esmeraldas TaxID=1808958 RepID=A0AAW0EYG6_9TRYP